MEIQLQLPEADKLNGLIRQVESCRSRCVQILKDLDSLKVVPADLFILVLAIDVEILHKTYYFDRKSNSFLVNGRIFLLLFQSWNSSENIIVIPCPGSHVSILFL